MEPPETGGSAQQTCGGGPRFPAVCLQADRPPQEAGGPRKPQRQETRRGTASAPRGFRLIGCDREHLQLPATRLSFRRTHDPNPR